MNTVRLSGQVDERIRSLEDMIQIAEEEARTISEMARNHPCMFCEFQIAQSAAEASKFSAEISVWSLKASQESFYRQAQELGK